MVNKSFPSKSMERRVSHQIAESNRCKSCKAFFSRFRCNSPLECDCPRCQNTCECPDRKIEEDE